MTTPTHTYRIVRIADPRSRGACSWYEIEGIAADGSRWHVATCDDRREARELVRQIEAADAARSAAAAATADDVLTLEPAQPCPPEISDADPDAIVLEPCSPELAELDLLPDLAAIDARRASAWRTLTATREAAERLQRPRRAIANEAGTAAWLDTLHGSAWYGGSLVSARDRVARALRAARAEYDAAHAAFDFLTP